MRGQWQKLLADLELRLIRTLDVIGILVLDAVVLAVGYLVIRGAEILSGSDSRWFAAARLVSEALFLVLYLLLVAYDLLDFLRRK
jgi:hypothetical protein